MKKSSGISLDFIKSLRKAQNQLYKEDAMNEVESESVKSQIQQIISNFNQTRINQKEFFFQMSRIISPTNLSESLCSINNSDVSNNISPSPISSLPILRILRFISAFQLVDPAKNEKAAIDDKKRFYVDMLTFSIIPSYFNFFWTECSIKSLYKFFTYLRKEENNEFYDSLARVAFTTPFFLHFSQQCFQSVFSELLSLTSFRNVNKKALVEKIRCNIKKYQHFLPDETIVVILCSSDPLRTLVNSFFNIALSSPIAAQVLGFFHFSCKPSKDILNFLKTIFDSKHYNSYVKSIFDAIVNCSTVAEDGQQIPSRYLQLFDMYSDQFKDVKDFNQDQDDENEFKQYESKINESSSISSKCSSSISRSSSDNTPLKRKSTAYDSLPLMENKKVAFETVEPIPNKFNLFNISDVFYAQEIFQSKFLSSIDISLIQLTDGKVSSFIRPEKIEYYTDSKVKQQKFSKVKTDEKTMLSRAIFIAPMVRHLLQRADPIPFIKSLPSELSLYDFFETFLVKRGNILYLPERIMNFNQIISFIPKNSLNEETIKEALSCTQFTRMKKIKALSTFASIELKIYQLNESSQQQINLVQIINGVHKMSTVFKLSKSIPNYIKYPKLIISEYNSNMLKYSEPEYCKVKSPKKILFTILTEKIDFMTFSAQRESLRKFPVSLKEYDKKFASDAHDNLLRFVKECFPPKKNNTENKFNKNDYITKKIMKVVVERREVIDMMTEAFLEHSLMRKVELFSISLGNFQHFLQVDCPPGKDLGSDEFTPAFASLIMLCNPPMTVTNYVYLHDMITGDLPISEIFGGYASTIPLYLRVAIEFVIPDFVKNPPFLLDEE